MLKTLVIILVSLLAGAGIGALLYSILNRPKTEEQNDTAVSRSIEEMQKTLEKIFAKKPADANKIQEQPGAGIGALLYSILNRPKTEEQNDTAVSHSIEEMQKTLDSLKKIFDKKPADANKIQEQLQEMSSAAEQYGIQIDAVSERLRMLSEKFTQQAAAQNTAAVYQNRSVVPEISLRPAAVTKQEEKMEDIFEEVARLRKAYNPNLPSPFRTYNAGNRCMDGSTDPGAAFIIRSDGVSILPNQVQPFTSVLLIKDVYTSQKGFIDKECMIRVCQVDAMGNITTKGEIR